MPLGSLLMNKIFWDKKDIVMKQINRPRSYDVLNENGNVIIRNCRYLIPTNEKFTEKFSCDNIIPTTTKLPESLAQPQTANLPKSVTSSTNINPLKPIKPNGTRVIRSGIFEKQNNYTASVEICWLVSCVWKMRVCVNISKMKKKKIDEKRLKYVHQVKFCIVNDQNT